MQSSKFVAERKEYWERLRLLTLKIKKRGYRRLSSEEAQDFPNLYRKVCTDAETARTLKLAPDTITYVNTIVLKAHSLLYTSPRKTFRRLARFFTYDYPLAFAKNLRYILMMVVLFFGVGAISFTAVYHHPEYATEIMPESYKEMYKEAVSRSGAENIRMAGFYIQNNVTIAFGSFLLGVTFGLLTIVLVFLNGLFIGAFMGLVVSAGYGHNLFTFVIAHSSLELFGICIAAGAGLAIGVSLIRSGAEKRSLTFTRKAREVVPLFIVAGVFITLAAFIEGFVSASEIPLWIKMTIAIVTFIGIAVYSPLLLWKKLFVFIKKKRATNIRKKSDLWHMPSQPLPEEE